MLLGFGHTPLVAVETIRIAPSRPRIGSSVGITWEVANQTSGDNGAAGFASTTSRRMANTAQKVFKFKTVELGGARRLFVSASRWPLHELTTRTHYPGLHRIELLVNGHAYPVRGVSHHGRMSAAFALGCGDLSGIQHPVRSWCLPRFHIGPRPDQQGCRWKDPYFWRSRFPSPKAG